MPLHRHNPLLRNKLWQHMQADDAAGLLHQLQSLTVAEFRTAGYLLAEDLLPQCSSQSYWRFFMTLVPAHSKAYLGTFLKAAVRLRACRKLQLDMQALTAFAAKATPIDIHKTLDTFLALQLSFDEAHSLVSIFTGNQLQQAAPHLIKAGTPVAYYLLFRLLKTAEAEPDLLRHYAVLLMRKGDPLSFKLASAVRQYFDLPELPGNFSLQLQPYELSRLDQGFDAFMKALS